MAGAPFSSKRESFHRMPATCELADWRARLTPSLRVPHFRVFQTREGTLMKHVVVLAFAAIILSQPDNLALADVTADATAVIDKAISAMGGAEKLAKANASTWKTERSTSA